LNVQARGLSPLSRCDSMLNSVSPMGIRHLDYRARLPLAGRAGILDGEVMAVPIYEFRCNACTRKVALSYPSVADYASATPACTHCGSTDLTRLISRVRVARSEESRLESAADMGDFAGLDEDDPRALGRMMRKLSAETGEDMGPEVDEMIGRLEAGESPEAIEESMPELGGGMGDDLDF
jgi:putative FmdB family regulatory protein